MRKLHVLIKNFKVIRIVLVDSESKVRMVLVVILETAGKSFNINILHHKRLTLALCPCCVPVTARVS